MAESGDTERRHYGCICNLLSPRVTDRHAYHKNISDTLKGHPAREGTGIGGEAYPVPILLGPPPSDMALPFPRSTSGVFTRAREHRACANPPL